MTQIQQQKAAKEFAERWKGKGYEKGDFKVDGTYTFEVGGPVLGDSIVEFLSILSSTTRSNSCVSNVVVFCSRRYSAALIPSNFSHFPLRYPHKIGVSLQNLTFSHFSPLRICKSQFFFRNFVGEFTILPLQGAKLVP